MYGRCAVSLGRGSPHFISCRGGEVRGHVDGLSCLVACLSCYLFFGGSLGAIDDNVASLCLNVKDKSKVRDRESQSGHFQDMFSLTRRCASLLGLLPRSLQEVRSLIVDHLLVRCYDKVVAKFESINGDSVCCVMGRYIESGEAGALLSVPAFALQYRK